MSPCKLHGFNNTLKQMKTIQDRIEEIAKELNNYLKEDREQILYEELDRAVIYYSTQNQIIFEHAPTSYFIGELGEYAQTPEELAWWILYTRFYDRFDYLME